MLEREFDVASILFITVKVTSLKLDVVFELVVMEEPIKIESTVSWLSGEPVIFKKVR